MCGRNVAEHRLTKRISRRTHCDAIEAINCRPYRCHDLSYTLRHHQHNFCQPKRPFEKNKITTLHKAPFKTCNRRSERWKLENLRSHQFSTLTSIAFHRPLSDAPWGVRITFMDEIFAVKINFYNILGRAWMTSYEFFDFNRFFVHFKLKFLFNKLWQALIVYVL